MRGVAGVVEEKIVENALEVMAGGTGRETEIGRWKEKSEAIWMSVQHEYCVIG